MPNFRKIAFPLLFSLILASYTTYAALDTFVIEQVEGDVSFDSGFFDFSESTNDKTSKVETSKTSSREETKSSSEASTHSSDLFSEASSEPEIIDGPFTVEPVLTENSYTDRHIAISIGEEDVDVWNKDHVNVQTKVYYADVRLSSIKYLKTALAKDKYGQKIVEKTSSMAARNNAIFAVNGDYYGAQERGYVLRNGSVFRKSAKLVDKDKGDLAIFTDGSFEYFKEADHSLAEVQAMKEEEGHKAYQVFSFGPQLVKDGQRNVGEKEEVAVYSKLGNQRCSIGIVDELHYVFAVCDGRLSDSWGMDLYQMADYMIGRDCVSAYNLDGGGSATFWFNGKVLNRPNTNGDKDIGEREISDCVYIAA